MRRMEWSLGLLLGACLLYAGDGNDDNIKKKKERRREGNKIKEEGKAKCVYEKRGRGENEKKKTTKKNRRKRGRR